MCLRWISEDESLFIEFIKSIGHKFQLKAYLVSILNSTFNYFIQSIIQAYTHVHLEVSFKMAPEEYVMNFLEFIYRGTFYYSLPHYRQESPIPLVGDNFITSESRPSIEFAHPSIDRQKKWIPRYTFQSLFATSIIPTIQSYMNNNMFHITRLLFGLSNHLQCLQACMEGLFSCVGEFFGFLGISIVKMYYPELYPTHKLWNYILTYAIQLSTGFVSKQLFLKYFWSMNPIEYEYPPFIKYDRKEELIKLETKRLIEELRKEEAEMTETPK